MRSGTHGCVGRDRHHDRRAVAARLPERARRAAASKRAAMKIGLRDA